MKAILLISLLLTLGLQVSVTDTDKCSQCSEFKSQSDCENQSNGLGCEWKASACVVKTIIQPEIIKTYCELVQDPATKCAKTFGCAYVDSKCTHFTGCTAYVKTTLAECQAISAQCITNGVTCDDAKLCEEYKKEECETTPGLLSPYKCKLEGETCRELKCTEADATLTTDDQCDEWKNGCVTTGAGCIDVLPNCNALTGTAETCLKMEGRDGKCILDSTSTTGACKLRVCSEASLTTYDDTTCGDYKSGCKSTGFSCVDTFQGCSSYTGNQTSCLNFVGSDGKCAADSGATQCRARKCEDKVSGSKTDCETYLPGCKTNGITCVTTLGNCSTYKGIASTCAKIVGLDGNCKGTSTTDANASCAVKTCTDDDTGNETTDAACQTIQSDCKTTGKGCAKTITTACNTYTDDGNCNKYVGSDGKCKPGAGGATPKCAVRTCADNTTATTNTECSNYQSGCVTNGAGCVAETTCILTTVKAACSAPRSATCGWTDSCVQKSCTSYSTNQSLCENTKFSASDPCIWKNNTCQSALCSDYTFTDDAVCDSKKKDCVTNGTKCADPTVCAEFAGTMTQCRAYKAKCTNVSDSVAATTPCVVRTCADTDITASQDSDCENYLTGCVYAGTNKCISKTSGCTAYSGASTGECEIFTGYQSATVRDKCWWTSTSADTTKCVKKACNQATGMTDTAGCGTFLTGCVYDGKDSCVDQNAGCTSLKYKTSADECQSMTGTSGADKCWNGTGANCKKRECSDAPNTNAYDTDGECETFLTGCLTTGLGCTAPSTVCSSYTGTSTTCAGFKGNSIPCLRKLACVKPTVSCTSKTDATSNKDCQTYSNTCVLTFGSTNCQGTSTNCTDYTVSGTSATEKTAYCNSVKTTAGATCAYDTAIANTCVARTCALWSPSIGVTCTDYAGNGACTIGKNQQCFAIGACNTYTLPASLTTAPSKKTFCNNQWNAKGGLCTHDGTSATTCKEITTCEEVVSPQTQDDCFDQSKQSNCVLIGTGCVTIKTTCESYDITNVTAGDKTTLCASLKSNNSGVITACKFVTGNACSTHTCEQLTPTSAADCKALPNCTYYSSKCYTIQSCTTIDASGATDADKQLFCQNMKNTGGTDFCSFTTGPKCSAPKQCADYSGLTAVTAAGSANLTTCNAKRDKDGTICTYADSATACSKATGAEICTLLATGINSDADCDIKTLPKACKKASATNTCEAKALCSSITPTANSELSECQAITGPDGFYCSWSTGNCSIAADDCSSKTGSNLATCQTFINKYGKTCSWRTGSNCADPDCVDTASPKSQADCDLTSSGCTFQNDLCVKLAAGCASITFPASINTNDKKFAYCNGIITSNNEVCTFQDSSSNCVVAAGCGTYTAVGADFAAKLAYCKKFINTDNYDCTYQSGNNCQEVADLCTSYTVGTAADCTSLKDSFARSCVAGSALACDYQACNTISSPTKQEDCDAKAAGCTYQNNKCIVLGTCASYTITGGSGATNFCNGLKDSNGVQCYANNDNDGQCTARACNDAATQYFTTNKECQDYSPQCKSDGVGCVNLSDPCTNLYGDSTSCSWFLDETGQGKCSAATPATDTQACAATTCEMNVTALSQSDCDSFISNGGCKWKNPGCYSKTVPCDQYRGTATECQGFVGNSVKCFGDSATRAACRARTCADKKIAVDDADCAAFMDDCIFNGEGCVHKSSACSSFKGTNATCKNFKGVNQTKLCWSTSATQGNCIDRVCTHLQGLSDADCKAHMNDSNCITDGAACVQGPKLCSYFRGNDETCSQFTATDGPCKASSISTTAVSCTPRVCHEAPNTYTTDAQCSTYHSTCKTNGRGCQSSLSCGDIQNKAACAASTSSCIWTSSCRATSTTCSSLTTFGQSVCVNNPTQKCAWYTGGGNSANAKCRDYTCEDYDATLTTHEACQTASNKVCTTTGAGCVTFGTCSTYTNKSVCESATTTETSKKCKWEGVTCRQQKCSDLTGATDEACDTLLKGCKSNGTSCIGPNFNCSVFNGAEKFCLIDSYGQPCLYKEGTCYSYDNCTDITTTTTQSFCQKFSPNCVQGSTTCKALNQCSGYDRDSCLIGINNTKCGWLPTGACAEFKQCSEATGTTWSDCSQWNSSCVSDGTSCVPIGDCGSYLKPLSCEGNYDTDDNACFWTGTACRLKQCSDGTGVTDSECSAFVVKEGVCTTNGTACVLRAACTSYSTEAACTVGSDGIPCIFSFPLGTTTGTKSCRPKDCIDIAGTTNDQCVGQINNKKCVSNGKTCVNQGTCASYKNKVSCAAGGSDNSRCVFTAAPTTADPLAGTCQAFTSCASASGDSATCLLNRSCKYTESTKKCETTDCKTFTPTGTCQPIPSFDAKTFTICTSSANGCTAGDPTTLAQTDCFSQVSKYTYTWNAGTSKCQSCKGSSSTTNNSTTGNTTTDTTTDSGYVLGVSMALAILGFMA